MRIRRLRLRGFRNISSLEIHPATDLNFLLGANAQGKTSVLEAISLLATLRSFRGAKAVDVLQLGEHHGEIDAIVESQRDGEVWQSELSIRFHRETTGRVEKIAFADGKAYRSSLHFLTHRFGSQGLGFHAISFNPSDHELVRGEPRLRRLYLDQAISAEDPKHLTRVRRYARLLEQRNAVLRAFGNRSELATFTDQIAQVGAEMIEARMHWLHAALPRVRANLQRMAPKQLEISFRYKATEIEDFNLNSDSYPRNLECYFAGQGEGQSLQPLKQALVAASSRLSGAELAAQTTLFGPHRDDWTLCLGDEPLRSRGSQGEVRAVLLGLKLAELALYRERSLVRPLLLIDDFSSELDQKRRANLLELLGELTLQAFVTSTEDVALSGKRFWIAKGELDKVQQHRDEHATREATIH